jgi:tetratricopeptide (TPR) repeat protein
MRKALLAAVIAGLVLGLYAVSTGDVIYLNTGGIVKGKIIERDIDKLVVRTPYGLTTIPADDVDYIEEGGSLKEMYEERLKQIREDDVNAHYNLGVWLRNVGMYDEAKNEFQRVLKLDPDHPEARCELGYVRKEGKWLMRKSTNYPKAT